MRGHPRSYCPSNIDSSNSGESDEDIYINLEITPNNIRNALINTSLNEKFNIFVATGVLRISLENLPLRKGASPSYIEVNVF